MATLRDKLSHLPFAQACKLLGPQGKTLIMGNGVKSILDSFQLKKQSDIQITR